MTYLSKLLNSVTQNLYINNYIAFDLVILYRVFIYWLTLHLTVKTHDFGTFTIILRVYWYVSTSVVIITPNKQTAWHNNVNLMKSTCTMAHWDTRVNVGLRVVAAFTPTCNCDKIINETLLLLAVFLFGCEISVSIYN